jgi:hypothetical protein
LLVLAQALSLIVTAVGALLGTIGEFRHEGKVTKTGRVAAGLIIVGLLSNAVTLYLQERESKASEKRSQEYQLRLESQNRQQRAELFQQSLVRRLSISVAWDDTKALDDVAVLTRIHTRNGDYFFVIPTEESNRTDSFPPSALRESDHGWKSIRGATASFVDTLASAVTLREGDVPTSDWRMEVRGDLVQVNHNVVIPTSSERPDGRALRQALATIKGIIVSLDGVPVHQVAKASFSRDLLLSTSPGQDFVSEDPYQQARFYMGPPPWLAIAAAAKPEQVGAPNTLPEVFKKFNSVGQDIIVEPGG